MSIKTKKPDAFVAFLCMVKGLGYLHGKDVIFKRTLNRYMSGLQSFFPKPGGFLRSKGVKEQIQLG